jgi:hypothetical protein
LWERALAYRYQVQAAPAVDPLTDNSIKHVIQNADYYVNELCLAIRNVEDVLDSGNSTDVKRMRAIASGEGNSLTLKDVESTARHIMVHLVRRCVVGYADFKQREKAGEDDLILNCQERINRVIQTLKQAKSVCRDVLEEDARIALLVHQPGAILATKAHYLKTNATRKRALEENKEKSKELVRLKASLISGQTQAATSDQGIALQGGAHTVH